MNTVKFPNGYDVTVLRKQDIIDCIDDNIIDKDVAFVIIEQLEKDALDFLKDGVWTGIPFIGNIRRNQVKQRETSEKQQALINDVKESVSEEEYLLFRRNLRTDNVKAIKATRYFNYIASRMANHNRKQFKMLCNKKGERFAKIFIASLYDMKPIETTDNYGSEQEFDN